MEHVFFPVAGKNAHGQNRIYAVNEGGQLLSYAPTNPLSGEVIVGADGWGFGQNFSAVFAGVDKHGESHIYAVTMPFGYYNTGQMLSYKDDGTPGNVGGPVVVGKGIWVDMFMFLFADANAAGQNRIYGVNKLGQLLSYAPTNPVSDEVIVGDPSNQQRHAVTQRKSRVVRPRRPCDEQRLGTLRRRELGWPKPHLRCLR